MKRSLRDVHLSRDLIIPLLTRDYYLDFASSMLMSKNVENLVPWVGTSDMSSMTLI